MKDPATVAQLAKMEQRLGMVERRLDQLEQGKAAPSTSPRPAPIDSSSGSPALPRSSGSTHKKEV